MDNKEHIEYLKNKIRDNTSTKRDKLILAKKTIMENHKNSGVLTKYNPRKYFRARNAIKNSHINRILAGRTSKSTKLQSINNHANNLADNITKN